MYTAIRFSILMATVCLIVRCDSNSPGAADEIVVLQSLDNFQVRAGQERSIVLTDYFQHAGGSPLRFEAEGDSIPVRISDAGNVLLIGASVPNTSREVSIRATTETGVTLDTTFSVVTNCATAPTIDEVSYFPNQIGQEWVFDYASGNSLGSGVNSSGSAEGAGILTWVIVDRVDTCESIQLSIDETLDITRISSGNHNNFIPDTTEVLTTNTRMATLWGDSLTIEGYIEGNEMLPLPEWIQPLSLAPDTISADSIQFVGFGGSTKTERYAFARDGGLTNWFYRSSIRRTWSEEGLTIRNGR